ncbi:MAG: RiPP maturation radical SAM C-methyltransferase [Acidobacteriota bacterium]
MDICLVNMPYTPIERPSVALGLLQAVLIRDGWAVETVYADLLFAREIGLHRHMLITGTRPQDALGDWTFSHLVFPGFESDHDRFIRRLIDRNRMYRGCDAGELKDIMLSVREKAGRFVDDLAGRILERKPFMVGCGTTYMQHLSSIALLKRVREFSPDVVTVMGGANCETIMGRSTHSFFPWVDYVVSGEADALITPLVRAIREKGTEVAPEMLPEGVFAPVHRRIGYPRGPADGAPRATVESLDDLPVPDYDDYFRTLKESSFRDKIAVSLPIETSRGCWWGEKSGCVYCSLNGCGRRFRSKLASQVVRDLDSLYHRHGVTRFLAADNSLEMRYFRTLFPDLARKRSPYRIYYQIMSNLSREQVRTMRDAGLTWVWCGIESLSDKVLAHMNKGCKSWQNVQFLKWCRQYGVYVGWYIMCDFPGEADEWYWEMARMLPLLSHLQPPWAFARVRLDRYSQYHGRPQEFGLKLQPAELFSYIYPISPDALASLVCFFEDEERAIDPRFETLLTRPGILAASKAAAQWKIAFWSESAPCLIMTVTDSAVRIRDTRPVAVASSFVLEGVEREIHLACDAAVGWRRLLNQMVARGHSRAEVEAAAHSLLDRKLMIEVGGRLLALALCEPATALPERSEYPGGAVLLRGGGDRFSDAGVVQRTIAERP